MSIKRSIFLSNILMIVVPALLLTLFAFTMWLISIGRISHWDGRRSFEENFVYAKNDIRRMVREWNGNAAELTASVDDFNAKWNKANMLLSIEEQDALLDTQTLETALARSIARSDKIKSEKAPMNISIFIHPAGDCSLVLAAADFGARRYEPLGLFAPGLTLLVLVVAFIMITNTILTAIMYKRIIKPLDTLKNGVREIRDGNLDYRIEYRNKDEFSEACADFNDMAERLWQMVNSRQKDEESRKELIAGISHDLRTPLTAIKAYIEGIEKGVAATPELQMKYFETIKIKAEDLARIIDQLFLFSKLDVDEFPIYLEIIRFAEAVEDMVDELKDEYSKKGLFIEIAKSIPNIHIRADLQWLRSVLINIFENSLHYKDSNCAHLSLRFDVHDHKAVLRLEDDGPGVPAESLPKLFDVFYRSDPARYSRGSGLGLAIAAKVMHKMDGTIWAENVAEKKGLAIMLAFPLNETTIVEATLSKTTVDITTLDKVTLDETTN